MSANLGLKRLEVVAHVLEEVSGITRVIKVNPNCIAPKISDGSNGSTGNNCGVVNSRSADPLKGAGTTEESELTSLSSDRDRKAVNFHGPILEMAYELKYRAAAPVRNCNIVERNDRPERAMSKRGDTGIVYEPIVHAAAGTCNDSRKSISATPDDASHEGARIKITAIR